MLKIITVLKIALKFFKQILTFLYYQVEKKLKNLKAFFKFKIFNESLNHEIFNLYSRFAILKNLRVLTFSTKI